MTVRDRRPLPDVLPSDTLASHVAEAKIEDALFLIASGVHFDAAARRVGYTPNALDRALSRAGISRSTYAPMEDTPGASDAKPGDDQ